ncbi:PhzF family phenazine biosynthesis protein [Orbus mooreae]|uniref:PhzF family phenazine biosynthesis protein n=1 Tax=Orbus mooreae TaxID=3074107 RepID=UPI00370D5998
MLKQYVVDAFAERVFEGNPAAVCITDKWLDDKLMQLITSENNLSETAFAVKENKSYRLRWFTPNGEIDLCGHATLATAFVIMNYYEKELTEIHFNTLSGDLIVNKIDNMYELDFPCYSLKSIETTEKIKKIIGFTPVETWIDRDLVCVLENENQIKNAKIDLENAKSLPGLLLHITARSSNSEYDCVSRSFAPKLNVSEDPVCGTGHCHIAPFWAKRLKKEKIVAKQESERSGILYCQVNDDRIKLKGRAVLYSISELQLTSF